MPPANAAPTPSRLALGRVAAIATLAVISALGAGCGGEASPERNLTASEAAALRDRLSDVRQAAARQDPEAARLGLRSFRREVRKLAAAKALTTAEQRRLMDGALQAEARAGLELAPEPAIEERPEAPESIAPPRGEDDDEGGDEEEDGGEGEGDGDD